MGVLENKENIWKSTSLWKIVPKGKGDLVRIEKISEEKPNFDSSTEIAYTESYSDNPNDQEGGKFKKFVNKVISEGKPEPVSSPESYTDNPNEGGKFIEIVYKVIKFLKNPFGGGDKVLEEDFEENAENDSWKKGQTNDDGYFTLEDPKSSKVLTAVSKDGLEIKGNFCCNNKHLTEPR